MDKKTWKIEKDLCRCCHSEGSFRNLAEPCLEMGEEEVYCDMLRDSFDIDLTPVPGNLCAPTYTICEMCIERLRDAFTFKKQVVDCEKKFREMYSKNIIIAAGTAFLIDVKQEPDPVDDLMKYETTDGADSDDDKASLGIKNDDSGDSDDEDDFKLSLLGAAKEAKKKSKASQKKTKTPKAKKQPKRTKTKKEKPTEDGDKEGAEEKTEKKGGTKYYRIQEGSYICDICSKRFASQPLVSQHYRFVHLKKRPRLRKCHECDMEYSGHTRAFHMEEHHGIPAPSCGVCEKKFRYQSDLERHQKKAHMGERTMTCDECKKVFFDALSLRIHKASHDVKKLECAVCSKRFRWGNNLKDHARIHSGDRRFCCPVCGVAFVQKSTMKQHVTRRHPGVLVL